MKPKQKIIKLNQKEVSRQLGISPSYTSMIIKGKRKSRRYEKKIEKLVYKAVRELLSKKAA